MLSPGALRCFGAASALTGACLLTSCGYVSARIFPKPAEPAQSELIAIARHVHEQRLARAETLRDPKTHWLTPDDCDGFLWQAKYSAAKGVSDVALELAEDPTTPGRFVRKPWPASDCKDSWSGDMGWGLIEYSNAKKDYTLLDRHIEYGEANATFCGNPNTCTWTMGSGYGAIYKPSLIGFIYRLRDSPRGRWPSELEYPGGLSDYQAHLQIMNIHVRGDIEGSITDAMHDRVLEHSTREPGNTFYWFLRGKYNGDMTRALSNCIDGTKADYVRCGVGLNPELCQLAEDIFACDLVLNAVLP